MTSHTIRTTDIGMRAFWVAIICACVLALSACGPKAYPSSRPKYGDSTAPVGPDKSHFRSQPKFQP